MLNVKDPYLLLSIVNTKLRDEADSFEELCGAYNVNQKEIEEKLANIGYYYEKGNNQFITK